MVDQAGLLGWDQNNRGNYFLLKSEGWREEIKSLYPGKKVSKYIFRFIDWLMSQYEIKRKNKAGYTIKMRWTTIAEILKFNQHELKSNPKRVENTLKEAMKAAKKLNYLSDYVFGEMCVLTLNAGKFYNPGRK